MKMKINLQESKRLVENTTLPDVLSVKEVKQILGIGRVSIYHLIETGKLSAFQMGRTYKISKQAVTRFLETWGGDRK